MSEGLVFRRRKVVSTSEPTTPIEETGAPPPETTTTPPETTTTPPPKVDNDAAKKADKERERKRIADARQRGLEEGIEQGKGYKYDDWPQEDKSYGSGNWLIDKLGLENEYLQGPVQLAESLSALPLRLATRGLKAIPEQVFSAKGARYDDRPEKEITLGHDPEQVAALTPGDEVPLREGGTDVRITSQLRARPGFAPSQGLDDVMPTLQDDTLSLEEKIQTLEAIVAANPAPLGRETPGGRRGPPPESVENTQARRQAEGMLLILENAKGELRNIRDKRARLKSTVTTPLTEEAEVAPEPEAASEPPSTPSDEVESDSGESRREATLKKLNEYKPGAGEYMSDRPIPGSSSEPVSTDELPTPTASVIEEVKKRRPPVSTEEPVPTPAPLPPQKKPETSATEDKTEPPAAKSMTDFYNYPVRSRAGRREKHPVTGKPGEHHGDDLVVPKDTPQPALLPGKVTSAGYHDEMGNYIIIDHDNGMQTRHFHGSNATPRFKVGERVEAGDTVLLTGTSGQSTGVHSHIEAWGDPDKHDELRIPGMKITRGGKVSLNMTDVLDYLNAQVSR